DFVGRRAALTGGAIRDRQGREIGRHDGVHRFTIGQRKGLGLAAGVPLYVIDIDADTADVTVGPKADLERDALTAARVNWIAGEAPAGPIRARARIRYPHKAAPATITPIGTGRVSVVFDEPQSAITPGQAGVFYDDDCVVGGGGVD